MLSTSAAQLDYAPRWASWLTGKPGVVLALLWGFAEGTLFFILPDVPLSLAAMFRPRRALMQVTAIVAGAVLGGALMFSWSVRGPSARNAVARVPLVTPAMFERAEKDYRDDIVEMALAHKVGDATYEAYQRGDLLNKRRVLVSDWADFVVGSQVAASA